MSTRSVLIVEDVDTMRELMGQMVAGLPGYRVSGLAQNGVEARFELSRRRPDLVLLDEVLPGESSLDLLEELARDLVPVILLTSMEDRVHDPKAPMPPGALTRLFKPGWKTLKNDATRFKVEMDKALGQLRG